MPLRKTINEKQETIKKNEKRKNPKCRMSWWSMWLMQMCCIACGVPFLFSPHLPPQIPHIKGPSSSLPGSPAPFFKKITETQLPVKTNIKPIKTIHPRYKNEMKQKKKKKKKKQILNKIRWNKKNQITSANTNSNVKSNASVYMTQNRQWQYSIKGY